MSEGDYETVMNKAIAEVERCRKADSIEEFYRGLAAMKYLLDERISMACSDGVNFTEFDDDPY